jgi:hypothetical protein
MLLVGFAALFSEAHPSSLLIGGTPCPWILPERLRVPAKGVNSRARQKGQCLIREVLQVGKYRRQIGGWYAEPLQAVNLVLR